MKRRCAVLGLGLLLAVFLGCENKSPPGGPGATGTNRSPATGTASRTSTTTVGTPEDTFQVETPGMATSLKQGESKTIHVKISRGKNFAQDVKLAFSGAPMGVKITPADNEIRASANEVAVTVEAAKDAALGEHTITVTGTPTKGGAETSTTFKIDVKKAG
jgi:uncharacterized membrane protein